MKRDDHQIMVYYNPEQSTAKQVLAYARSISSHIHEVEYHKTKFTTTLWRKILDMLGNPDPKTLLNKSNAYYKNCFVAFNCYGCTN